MFYNVQLIRISQWKMLTLQFAGLTLTSDSLVEATNNNNKMKTTTICFRSAYCVRHYYSTYFLHVIYSMGILNYCDFIRNTFAFIEMTNEHSVCAQPAITAHCFGLRCNLCNMTGIRFHVVLHCKINAFTQNAMSFLLIRTDWSEWREQ